MSRFSTDRLSVLQKNNAGRLSMMLNEDDYDYALELSPDDEYRQAAEALPRLVDFDDIDLSNIVDESGIEMTTESNQNETIQPFSNQKRASVTEINTQRNRMSNFDTSMLEMHTSSANKKRRSSVHNINGQDDPLSAWGAVDTEEAEENKSDEEEEFDFEADEEEQQYDATITGMGTVPHADAAEAGGINFNATGTSAGSSGNESFTSRWKRLSKKEFSFRLNMLKQHRKWVERAAIMY
jgi:hypothetical protein